MTEEVFKTLDYLRKGVFKGIAKRASATKMRLVHNFRKEAGFRPPADRICKPAQHVHALGNRQVGVWDGESVTLTGVFEPYSCLTWCRSDDTISQSD